MMQTDIYGKIKEISIEKLTIYANLTNCGFEFGNGGNEILVIPPGCNK